MPAKRKPRSKRHHRPLSPSERIANASHILQQVSPYDRAALTAAIRVGHQAGLSNAEIAKLADIPAWEVADAIAGIVRPGEGQEPLPF